MSKQVKNMAASVRAKLTNIAQKEKRIFDSVLLLYMQERLLYRLSVSEYSDKFVLKGGLLMFLLTEFKGRPTKDVDFLAQQISNDTENIKKIFCKICSVKCKDDGVRFDAKSVKVEGITKNADYQGVRVMINCYLGNARKTIRLDLGFGDVVIPRAKIIKWPILLDMEAPKIMVYSLESVVAEKFQAMLVLSVLNSRMKDFYDIYTLLNIHSFDGRKLQEAVNETLQRRHTIIEEENVIFTDVFAQDENRNKMWKAFLKRINRKSGIEFEEVMKHIKIFLKPIYDAIIHEEEFLMQWDNHDKKWIGYTKNK